MSSEAIDGDSNERSQRFALLVLEAFTNAGRLTDAEVERAGGPSDSYMTDLRKAAAGLGTLPAPRRGTQGRIESAAGWVHGSALKVWNGAEPTTVGGAAQDAQQFVESTGERVESGITNEDLLREILRSRAEYDQLRAAVRDVSERVEKLEQRDT